MNVFAPPVNPRYDESKCKRQHAPRYRLTTQPRISIFSLFLLHRSFRWRYARELLRTLLWRKRVSCRELLVFSVSTLLCVSPCPAKSFRSSIIYEILRLSVRPFLTTL